MAIATLTAYGWLVSEQKLPVIPPGGDVGEVLAKVSGSDYDMEWAPGGTGVSIGSDITTEGGETLTTEGGETLIWE